MAKKNIRVGRWDCFVCGHVGNLGPETHCTNCNATRPKDVVFYLPDDAKVVKKEDELEEAKAGEDWICSYCSSHNKTASGICSTCGNDRETEDKTLDIREISLEDLPNKGARGVERVTERPTIPASDKKTNFWRYILGATGLGGVFWWLFSFSTTIDVPVTEMYWEREIEVLEYKEVQEEDWQIPQGARDVQQFQAIHHYNKELLGYETKIRTKQVKVGEEDYVCGQKDLGNGYFEDIICQRPIYETREEEYQAPIYKEVPEYRTKYKYYIFRWKDINPIVASGSSQRVRWPDERPEMENQPDRYKLGDRKEKYLFWIETNKGEKIQYKANSYAMFKDLYIGRELKAEKSTVFGTFKGLKAEGYTK